MKRILVLLCVFISCSVWADAKDLLKERLAKVDSFYAQFKQTVTTADQQLIQEGQGELWVKRPNLFNWQINEPDETSIISDGLDFWMYTPAVEQLTIMSFKQATDNRLLMLITDSNSPVWQDYRVERKQNQFTLLPTDNSQKSYMISVLPTGMIADFAIIEEDGQKSVYELSHQTLGPIDNQRFRFIAPPGTTIDDQRNN
ncbi:outer membrane lipoprotein chaperone LolA [Frischella sp. Ac48]|uniref:Outer-membrane lipoprotein carrier protein n=1 Tax=Frischella japonica TaxID=2741544 RepID=A0ABR7QVB5_9GAMM|nr:MULTISPECIES: outer membrane lipoprotein chaperone LolA [Frischella]MBC9130159.1 outer membrane lipoprotein chaperone LolA [Frischella japonica]MBX4133143.1 outer membrane lipoprotein chaperone LolA [Frischella sp. Ac48]